MEQKDQRTEPFIMISKIKTCALVQIKNAMILLAGI